MPEVSSFLGSFEKPARSPAAPAGSPATSARSAQSPAEDDSNVAPFEKLLIDVLDASLTAPAGAVQSAAETSSETPNTEPGKPVPSDPTVNSILDPFFRILTTPRMPPPSPAGALSAANPVQVNLAASAGRAGAETMASSDGSNDSPLGEMSNAPDSQPQKDAAKAPKTTEEPIPVGLTPGLLAWIPTPIALSTRPPVQEKSSGKGSIGDVQSRPEPLMMERPESGLNNNGPSEPSLEALGIRNFKISVQPDTSKGAESTAQAAAEAAVQAALKTGTQPPAAPLESAGTETISAATAVTAVTAAKEPLKREKRSDSEPGPAESFMAGSEGPAQRDFSTATRTQEPAATHTAAMDPRPEPPAPPPVARHVSLDVGDAESKVRIVIRERNGSLDVQLDAATHELRRDLERASPALAHALDKALAAAAHNSSERQVFRVANMDFTSFGSATDADAQGRDTHRPKKSLKSRAVFADVEETAYASLAESTPNPL